MKKLLILLCLALIAALVYSFNRVDKFKNSSDNFEILAKDSIRFYKTKLGKEIATIKSLKVTQKELKQGKYISDSLLKDLTRKFKNVKSAVKIVTVTKIDTLKIRFDNPIETPFQRSFKVSEEFYKLSGNVSNTGLTINQISIPNTQRIVIGDRKMGFFKSSFEVSVSNSNPFMQTEGLQSQVVTERKKRWVIGAGALIDQKVNVGIGIFAGYSLIRF